MPIKVHCPLFCSRNFYFTSRQFICSPSNGTLEKKLYDSKFHFYQRELYQPDLTTHSHLMFVLEHELLILGQMKVEPITKYIRSGKPKRHLALDFNSL